MLIFGLLITLPGPHQAVREPSDLIMSSTFDWSVFSGDIIFTKETIDLFVLDRVGSVIFHRIRNRSSHVHLVPRSAHRRRHFGCVRMRDIAIPGATVPGRVS